MERSIYRIQLELQDIHTPYHLDVKRGDTGIRLILSVTDGGKPFHLTPDCMGVFTAKKPDGTCIYNECIFAAGDMVYDFTPQTTVQPGQLDCQLKLYGNDDRLLTTAAFLVTVHDTVYNEGDTLASETEVTALTKLVSETNALLTATQEKLEQGEFNGDSASIGENGNWWIGDTDTGKVAAVLNDEETTDTAAWSGKKVTDTCVDKQAQRIVTRTEVLELTSRDNHSQTENGTLVMDDGLKLTYENSSSVPLLILQKYNGNGTVRLRGVANGVGALDAVNLKQLQEAIAAGSELTSTKKIEIINEEYDIPLTMENTGAEAVDYGDNSWMGFGLQFSGCDGVVLHGLLPGEGDKDAVTMLQFNDALGNVEAALDGILALQNSLIGGESV